jgi:uncharacterized cupredoxin-like copper-binding protein
VEHQAIRRDGATLVMFALSAMALLAGVFSVGLGMRAITESKRNVQAAALAAPAAALAPPQAELRDFSVGLSTTKFAPGQQSLRVTNSSAQAHELLVFRSDLSPSAFPADADGNIVEDGAGITLVSDADNIDPGGAQDRTVDLTVPGTYVFLCNLPGHFKAGMFTTVTVG